VDQWCVAWRSAGDLVVFVAGDEEHDELVLAEEALPLVVGLLNEHLERKLTEAALLRSDAYGKVIKCARCCQLCTGLCEFCAAQSARAGAWRWCPISYTPVLHSRPAGGGVPRGGHARRTALPQLNRPDPQDVKAEKNWPLASARLLARPSAFLLRNDVGPRLDFGGH